MTRKQAKKALYKQTSLVDSRPIGEGVKKQSSKRSIKIRKKVIKTNTPKISTTNEEDQNDLKAFKISENEIDRMEASKSKNDLIEHSVSDNIQFAFSNQNQDQIEKNKNENSDIDEFDLDSKNLRQDQLKHTLDKIENFRRIYFLAQRKILSGEVDCDELFSGCETKGTPRKNVNEKTI